MSGAQRLLERVSAVTLPDLDADRLDRAKAAIREYLDVAIFGTTT